MMDKENQDLNQDRSYIADLGVPFVCPHCNELFGSQEYLSQHSDICHGIKHDSNRGTNTEYHHQRDREIEGFSPTSSHYPSSLRSFNFHRNLMSSSASSKTPTNIQRSFSSSQPSAYPPYSLETHELLSAAYHMTTHQPTEDFLRLSMHRNDALLSSTTERAHSVPQLHSAFSPLPVDMRLQYASNGGEAQLHNGIGLQTVTCPGCLGVYRSQWFLDQHIKFCYKFTLSRFENHSRVPEEHKTRPQACPHCMQTFINQFFLDQHMLVCTELNRSQTVVPPPVDGQSVEAQFPQAPIQVQHATKEQPGQNAFSSPTTDNKTEPCSPSAAPSQTSPSSQSVEASKDLEAAGFLHVCGDCGKSFTQKSNLKAHARVHSGERPYDCEDCGQSFAHKSNLKKHYRIHTQEKPFRCSLCGLSFSQSSGLTIHWRTHTGEKPFECPECKSRFSSNGNLKKHIIIHTGEKPFGCKVCGRRFQTDDALNEHAATHTGDKGFQCPMCDVAFTHRGGLEAHFRTHTGEKPFPCHYCDLTFARRGGLKAHMRTHTGEKPYVCSLCGQAFAHKSNLNAHNRTHTGEKPFGCSFCDQKFAHKSNLKKHVTLHRDKNVVPSPGGSLSDSSSPVSESSVTRPGSMISAVSKISSFVKPDSGSNFFDLLDMLERSSSQAHIKT